jgi:hypothetical protein
MPFTKLVSVTTYWYIGQLGVTGAPARWRFRPSRPAEEAGELGARGSTPEALGRARRHVAKLTNGQRGAAENWRIGSAPCCGEGIWVAHMSQFDHPTKIEDPKHLGWGLPPPDQLGAQQPGRVARLVSATVRVNRWWRFCDTVVFAAAGKCFWVGLSGQAEQRMDR